MLLFVHFSVTKYVCILLTKIFLCCRLKFLYHKIFISSTQQPTNWFCDWNFLFHFYYLLLLLNVILWLISPYISDILPDININARKWPTTQRNPLKWKFTTNIHLRVGNKLHNDTSQGISRTHSVAAIDI